MQMRKIHSRQAISTLPRHNDLHVKVLKLGMRSSDRGESLGTIENDQPFLIIYLLDLLLRRHSLCGTGEARHGRSG